MVNDDALALEAQRGRALVEESQELVLVLDAERRLVAASRRARETFPALEIGALVPDEVFAANSIEVPYEVEGRRETLVYLGAGGELAAYQELRTGFTAAVSHELRTPLARLLALLESSELSAPKLAPMVDQARAEIEHARQLIDEILFLSELETGREVVALGATPAVPVLDEVVAAAAERALRADVEVKIEGDAELELPIRPRMLRVLLENLVDNALRYAGPRTSLTLSVARQGDSVVLTATDTGAGVSEDELPRLFERFYRGDRARASHGTGLGLAIVKHIVTAAGGEVEASSASGRGLQIRCAFPA